MVLKNPNEVSMFGMVSTAYDKNGNIVFLKGLETTAECFDCGHGVKLMDSFYRGHHQGKERVVCADCKKSTDLIIY